MRYRSELLYEYAKEHIRDQDVPPVFVPSYNRPDATILRRLLVEPEFPIVLCIRREQEELYAQWKNKCSIMLLDGVNDIAQTRREIIRQVAPYVNRMFMFDDDITELDFLLPSTTKTGTKAMRTSKLHTGTPPRWIDILKMWVCLVDQCKPELTLSTIAYRPDSWHIENANKDIEYNSGACIQCILIDTKNLTKNDIQYRSHEEAGNEDYALQFDIMSKGLLTTVFTDLMYNCPAVNSHPGGCQNANGYSDAHERYKWYVSCAKNYYKDHPGIRYVTTKRTGIESVKFIWKYWRKT